MSVDETMRIAYADKPFAQKVHPPFDQLLTNFPVERRDLPLGHRRVL
jgi:hypothetical protein